MLPLLVEIRPGVYINLQYLVNTTLYDDYSVASMYYGQKIVTESVVEPFNKNFKLIVQKFHKEIIKELT